jgi:hypothetical protein
VGARTFISTNCSTHSFNIPEHNTRCYTVFIKLVPFLLHQPLLDVTVGKIADVMAAYATLLPPESFSL